MRYIAIIFGIARAFAIKILLLGRFSFRFPMRYGKNVVLSCRRGGKILLNRHVSLNDNAHLAVTYDAILKIGNFSGIGDNNVITAREKIIIGNNVMLGPNVCIYDHDHVYDKDGIMRDMGYKTAPVIIEDNVWIGAGVIILKGVHIGSGSVIGAGSVIKKDVPSNSLVYNKRDTVIVERILKKE